MRARLSKVWWASDGLSAHPTEQQAKLARRQRRSPSNMFRSSSFAENAFLFVLRPRTIIVRTVRALDR